MNRRLLALAMLLPAFTVFGHHSVSAYFDTSQVIEVKGELTEVRWRNPHVGFTINVRDENGQETSWEISGTSLSHLGRLGLTADMFTLGDVVTFAGSPSKQSIPALQTSNVLLPNGEEIALNTTGRRQRPLRNQATSVIQSGAGKAKRWSSTRL